MSVYVDDMAAKFGRMTMSHMIADSHDELIAMAKKIGVAEKWIQKRGEEFEHFDICQSKKNLAIEYGAVEVSQRDLVLKIRARRMRACDK